MIRYFLTISTISNRPRRLVGASYANEEIYRATIEAYNNANISQAVPFPNSCVRKMFGGDNWCDSILLTNKQQEQILNRGE